MKVSKKILALALAGFMTVPFFAGCSSDGGSAQDGGNNGGNSSADGGAASSAGGTFKIGVSVPLQATLLPTEFPLSRAHR